MIVNQFNMKKTFRGLMVLPLMGILLFSGHSFAENDYAGLWVGTVALSHVNEVAVPLDETNTPIAPDPEVPTASHDEAYLRLILHVNASGQVNLLKDVAILRQDESAVSGRITDSESDYVLVTDDRLYADFPNQQASRIASAVFDFGDSKATDAVDVMVDSIIGEVAPLVLSSNVTATASDSVLRAVENSAALAGASSVDLAAMNANAQFINFLATHADGAYISSVATNAPLDLTSVSNNAVVLRDSSFYKDERALYMVAELEDVITNAVGAEAKEAAAHNLVARYLDFGNEYQRFISGRSVGDMIVEVAQVAADAVVNGGVVSNAVNQTSAVFEVIDEASGMKIPDLYGYTDTASSDAVNTILDAMIHAANASTGTVETLIAVEVEIAGALALKALPRYELHAPTDDYISFVTSDTLTAAVAKASKAAAEASVKEAKNDPFHNEQTLRNAAKIAAVQSLKAVYSEAARARQTELPLMGLFGVSKGDARLVHTLASGENLGAPALTGTAYLPAAHPTNPFRHRRHPDHTVGIDIQRDIRIDFDAAESNQLARASFSVDQITGTYREEIFGLHKALGPDLNIGLKVEGTFELNRVSHIDTLNSL